MNKLEKAKKYVKEHEAEIIAGAIQCGLTTLALIGYYEWGFRRGIKGTAKLWVEEMNNVATEKGLPKLTSKVTGNLFKGFNLAFMTSEH